jgi:hypothetical protein
MDNKDNSLNDRLAAVGSAFANIEIGRFQAAILAVLFACVWCVIGLLAGYLLSLLVVSLSPQESAGSWPATLIFVGAAVSCTGYGVIRGWRLYRSFSKALEHGK